MPFVQAVGATGTTASSITTAAITTTTGNAVTMGGTGGVTVAASDSKANTWNPHAANPYSGTGGLNGMWYAMPIVGGSGHTFTFTTAASQLPSMIVHEFSGLGNLHAQGNSLETTNVTTHSTGGPVVTTVGCDLSFWQSDNDAQAAEVYTATGGWTGTVTQGAGNTYTASFGMYQNAAPPGTYNGTFTSATVLKSTGMIMAFSPPPGPLPRQIYVMP